MSASNTDTGDTTIISTAATKTTLMDGGDTAGAGCAESLAAMTVSSPAPLREALISTAVNFLQNSKVRYTTLMQKQHFLRSKGLTAEEIQLACERAGVFSKDPNNPTPAPTVINMGISSQTNSQLHSLQPHQSAFGKIREALHSIALLSGLAYAIYLFWKKYLEPFLFGKKKKGPVDEVIEAIDKKMDVCVGDVSKEIVQIKETMLEHNREHTRRFSREFINMRNEIEAIKGLLLNRKQFSQPINAGPPSIPAWQLASSPHQHHRHHSQSDNDNEKADDAGSGSGSSETEVVTKNSDSSLEIM